MSGRPACLRVSPQMAGARLDALLASLCPGLGLRGRRRLCQQGRVTVNGQPRPPGYAVRAGDCLTLLPAPAPAPAEGAAPVLLTATNMPDDLRFCAKPAGMHTVALAGSDSPSLEGWLPRLFPRAAEAPRLLTRLDWGTSGIVALALSSAAASRWRQAEQAGHCRKGYLALLTGRLEGELTITRALDTAHRSSSRVLPQAAPPDRHTHIRPLCWPPSPLLADCPGLTLALCHILRGARHQIRAHAAHAGHPLWGDTRYGGPPGAGRFFLHHGWLRLGAGHCHCPCPWPDMLSSALVARAGQSDEWALFAMPVNK